MIEPIVRIVARWFLIPFLVWLGLPQDSINAILSDPDVKKVLAWGLPMAVTVVEGWYLWARRRGRST